MHTIQGANVVTVPRHSDMVLQLQVVVTEVPVYHIFYLPDTMNTWMRQVMYPHLIKRLQIETQQP